MEKKITISRLNFKFNRIVNIQHEIDNAQVFEMGKDDVDKDINIPNKKLSTNETFYVFQNNDQSIDLIERYCYVKIKTTIGNDKQTEEYEIKEVIVDENIINISLFTRIMQIILQQKDNELNNRIVVGNINQCFKNNISKCANKIGRYIYDLFENYTSKDSPTYRQI